MEAFDINCLLGHWPFRRIRKAGPEDLFEIHRRNRIVGGCVSSLNAIFYNDPYEGDRELREVLKDSCYQRILTVNPTLPGYIEDIGRGIEELGIRGVRIHPGYHGYRLDDPCMETFVDELAARRLPLLVTTRMEDDRLEYGIAARPIPIEEIRCHLMRKPRPPTVLLTLRYNECIALSEEILAAKECLIDTSGLKDRLFTVEKLLERIPSSRIAYGSLHPLQCLQSTMLLVARASIDDADKTRILRGNAMTLFG